VELADKFANAQTFVALHAFTLRVPSSAISDALLSQLRIDNLMNFSKIASPTELEAQLQEFSAL
jgi:hypothetical protein